MIDIQVYLGDLGAQLRKCYGARLLYMGLQGSYQRGEAKEESDLDVMVLLDELRFEDMAVYRAALDAAGHAELACGFIADRADMQRWNVLEICHLLHTTQDVYGRLADYVPQYTRSDVIQFVKLSVGNLYHGLCHQMIHASHAQALQNLPGAYKAAFFALQNLHYLESGSFITTKSAMIKALKGTDYAVMTYGGNQDDAAYALLFRWCKEALGRVDAIK